MKHRKMWRVISILITIEVLIGAALTLSCCRNNSVEPNIWELSSDKRTATSIDGDVIVLPNGVYFLGCTDTVLMIGKGKTVNENFHFQVNGMDVSWYGRQMIIDVSDTRSVICQMT